jgi:hypothetical protein
MTESPRSLRWSWISFGWFIAVSIVSLILLALTSFGIIGTATEGTTIWVALAMVVGFFTSGVFVGTRVAAAPILHGLLMGLFSLAAWIGINLAVGEPMGESTWRSLDALSFGGLLLLQTVSAVVGTRIGVRWMRRPVSAV